MKTYTWIVLCTQFYCVSLLFLSCVTTADNVRPDHHYMVKTAKVIKSSYEQANDHTHDAYTRRRGLFYEDSQGHTTFLQQAVSNAETILEQGVAAVLEQGVAAVSNDSYEVSSHCLNQTEQFLGALATGQQWALKMVDAAGKPPSGILDFNMMWLGSYDECLSVNGQYCKATFQSTVQPATVQVSTGISLLIGLCAPSSCSHADVTALVRTGIFALPVNTTVLPDLVVLCQQQSMDFDTKAIAAIVICSIFAFIMAWATVYDILFVQYIFLDKCSSPAKYKPFSDAEEANTTSSSSEEYTSEKTPLCERKHPEYDGKRRHKAERDGASHVNFKSGHKNSYKPGRAGQMLLSFSVYTNAAKLLNTNQPTGSLSAVNGIRFLSMSWVILGHTYAFSSVVGDNTGVFLVKMMKRFSFQAIANATVSVDSFFLLSGLLLAYLALKQLEKSEGAAKFGWGMYYFHRFWRLTPPYMLALMVYACLLKYFSNGPMWPQTIGNECEDTWWKNLLYINNFFDNDTMCVGWSWYLSNDMQFFILSPLLLIPLYYFSIIGMAVCILFLVACFISAGVISSTNDIPANAFADTNGKYGLYLYIKPYTRIGPYVVGIMTGYLLYVTKCKIRIPKALNLLGWAFATGTALSVLYGLYDTDGNNLSNNLSTGVNALYNAVSRSAWGASLAWVIFACATGYGGFVNTLLSWSPFVPLGRLTYCAYLVHPMVMYLAYNSRATLIHFDDLEVIYLFLGHMVISYMTAFVVSLAFESPMMGLEKAIFGRGKSS